MNGAVPALIAVAASSSNTVFVKLSPLLPRPFTSVTTVPPGFFSVIFRSPSNVCVTLTLALTSETGPTFGNERVELTPAALLSGIATPGLTVTVCGDPATPVGTDSGIVTLPCEVVTARFSATEFPHVNDAGIVTWNADADACVPPFAPTVGHVDEFCGTVTPGELVLSTPAALLTANGLTLRTVSTIRTVSPGSAAAVPVPARAPDRSASSTRA